MNLIYSDRKPISSCLRPEACVGIAWEGAQGIFFRVIQIFYIFTVVYKFVKNYKDVFLMGAFY